MTIIDAMHAQAVVAPALPRMGDNPGRAEEGRDPVVIDMDPQPLADQLRWRRVEDLVDQEAPGPGDTRDHFGEVGGAPGRKRAQGRHLDADLSIAAAVAAGHQFIDEAAPVGQFGKIPGPAQDQGLVQCHLQMVVVGLDRTVLMRLSRDCSRDCRLASMP